MNPRLLAVVVLSSVCAFHAPAWADDAPAAATEETAPAADTAPVREAAAATVDAAAAAVEPVVTAAAETAPSATAAPAAAGKEDKDKDGGKTAAKDGVSWRNPFGRWVYVVIGFLGVITVWYTLVRPRAKQDE